MKGIKDYKEKYKDCLIQDDLGNEFVTTFSPTLNHLLGGGLKRGVIVEVYGHEGSGKSTLCYSLVSHILNKDKGTFGCILDTEGGICSKEYMNKIGVNNDNTLLMSMSEGEKVFDVIDELVCDKKCAVIVVDSIASLLTEEEMEDGTNSLGGHARLISRRVKKTICLINQNKSKTILLFVNQMRSKINEMWKGEMNFTTSGGKALKYYASLRLEAERKDFILEKEQRIGFNCKLKVVKSRFCAPFEACVLPFIYGLGYSEGTEIVDRLIDQNKIIKSGSWFYIQDKETKMTFRSKTEIVKKYESDLIFKKLINNLIG